MINKHIINSQYIRVIFIITLFLFLFFFFNASINLGIQKILFVKSDFSNIFLDILLIGCSIICIIYLFIKFLSFKYLPSSYEVTLCGALLFILSYYIYESPKLGWKYHSIIIIDHHFKYIYLLIIPLIFYFLLIFINFLIKQFKSEIEYNNNILNDNAIRKIEDDRLGYNIIVNKIKDIINNEHHQKSLSIGLVGPWGNGKSGIINIVREYIDEQESSFIASEIVSVHFLPYLNHKDDDIINEFFISLSKELSTYNGKLSNQILAYSQKLTNLYNDKNIVNFFDRHIAQLQNVPAKELYDDINCRLKEINKKIVVFIDDLDRLNENEILQVLKLIRNTADFWNTIFIVAMDKEYVISKLKNNQDILTSNFIDKFFQLEIYLPEIESSILKKYFQDELMKSRLTFSANFETKLLEAINDKNNLFEDYVKNFRDIKRVINQIVFEYPFYQEDIDLKDFMNFVYFKLKFPKAIKILNVNRNQILKIEKNKTYELIKNEESKVISLDDIEDKVIFNKTLEHLFGDKNSVSTFNSIKFENNFRMLMQQRIHENFFKELEFKNLFEINEENLNDSLRSLFGSKKITQLLDRFDYFNTDDNDQINRSIIILLNLYEKKNEYVLFESNILKLLDVFVQRKKEIKKQNISTWVINNVFENSMLSVENRLLLYINLWKYKSENSLWDIEQQYVGKDVLKLFKEYLMSFNSNLWEVNDFSFFRIYHGIKIIGKIKGKLDEIIKEFWNKNNIEILCAQFTDFDSFSLKAFRISEVVTEIFGSLDDYYMFIKKHNQSSSKEIKEYLHFFELLRITKYSRIIIYKFQNFELMNEKIRMAKLLKGSNNEYDEFEDYVQVFFETNSISLFESVGNTYPNEELIKIRNFSTFQKEAEKYYLVININKNDGLSIVAYGQMIHNFATKYSNWENAQIDISAIEKFQEFIPQKDNKYIKVFSIQPSNII